jgi:hypothetical protein
MKGMPKIRKTYINDKIHNAYTEIGFPVSDLKILIQDVEDYGMTGDRDKLIKGLEEVIGSLQEVRKMLGRLYDNFGQE